MPTYSYGFSPGQSSSGSVTIPKRALNVTVTVAGAKGGNGGSDAGGPGGNGGNGRGGTFTLPYRTSSHILSVYCGTKGSNGASGPPGGKGRAPGGDGGAATLDGGRGGRDSLGGGWSGCGGGGGGGSYVTDDAAGTAIICAAGGGGGGGGSWNRGGQNALDPYEFSGWTDPVMLFAAGDDGANCPYDGGGGGGGGGGTDPAADGGTYGTDNNRGGRRGESGQSSLLGGFIDEIIDTFENDGDGYAVIEYTEADWIPDAFTIQSITGADPNTNVIVDTGIGISGVNVPVDVFASTNVQVRKTGTTSWGSKLTSMTTSDSFDVRYKTPNSGGPDNMGYEVESSGTVCVGLSDEEADQVCASFTVTTRAPDRTPNEFEFDDSLENTPLANINIQSNQLTVQGFEVPLTIKSNYPIEVMINGDGIWREVEQI